MVDSPIVIPMPPTMHLPSHSKFVAAGRSRACKILKAIHHVVNLLQVLRLMNPWNCGLAVVESSVPILKTFLALVLDVILEINHEFLEVGQHLL